MKLFQINIKLCKIINTDKYKGSYRSRKKVARFKNEIKEGVRRINSEM